MSGSTIGLEFLNAYAADLFDYPTPLASLQTISPTESGLICSLRTVGNDTYYLKNPELLPVGLEITFFVSVDNGGALLIDVDLSTPITGAGETSCTLSDAGETVTFMVLERNGVNHWTVIETQGGALL